MSTATAVEAPPPAKGKKKLLLIGLAALLLLVLGGGGAGLYLMKKKAAAEAEAEGDDAAAATQAVAKAEEHGTPTFVPLDPFTVNLADRQAERYAQVAVTLEIEDPHLAEQIKNYMPVIRNNILMALADRTADELLGREGKTQLAERIRRETSRALGYQLGPEPAAVVEGSADEAAKKAKKKPRKATPMPIRAVHFSNFIVQ